MALKAINSWRWICWHCRLFQNLKKKKDWDRIEMICECQLLQKKRESKERNLLLLVIGTLIVDEALKKIWAKSERFCLGEAEMRWPLALNCAFQLRLSLETVIQDARTRIIVCVSYWDIVKGAAGGMGAQAIARSSLLDAVVDWFLIHLVMVTVVFVNSVVGCRRSSSF
jgi:hypothetical protein